MNAVVNDPVALSAILAVLNMVFLQLVKPLIEQLPFANPKAADQTLHNNIMEICNVLLQVLALAIVHLGQGNLSWALLPTMTGQVVAQAGGARWLYQITSQIIGAKLTADMQEVVAKLQTALAAVQVASAAGATLSTAAPAAPAAAPMPPAVPMPTIAPGQIPDLSGLLGQGLLLPTGVAAAPGVPLPASVVTTTTTPDPTTLTTTV